MGHGTSLNHIIVHMHTSACRCTLMHAYAYICMQMHVHYPTQTDSACICMHVHPHEVHLHADVCMCIPTEDPLHAFHPSACMSVKMHAYPCICMHVHADGYIWTKMDLGMHPIMCYNKNYNRTSIDPRLPSTTTAQHASLQLASPSVGQRNRSHPPFSPSEGR